jgi:hypothetical protein
VDQAVGSAKGEGSPVGTGPWIVSQVQDDMFDARVDRDARNQVDADNPLDVRMCGQLGHHLLAEETGCPGDDYRAHGPTMPNMREPTASQPTTEMSR